MLGIGGIEQMVLGTVVSGAVFGLLALLLVRRLGWVVALSWAGLLWSLTIIALVTLIPTSPDVGIVSAEGRLDHCSWDIGGPAPDGFWIFAGGQRLLNTALFVPAGLFLVLAVARSRWGLLLAPLGLAVLAAYSAGIEKTQLELARIDRACDVTDIIDNVTGAGIGFLIGLALLPVLRPWRHRRTRSD